MSNKSLKIPNIKKQKSPTARSDSDAIIYDVAALDLGLLLQIDPIPPIFIELVTLMAVIAAEEDWKVYTETGKHPTLEGRGRGSK